MKGRASRAVYMRLQPSLLSPPSDPEEREKKKGSKKKLHPFLAAASHRTTYFTLRLALAFARLSQCLKGFIGFLEFDLLFGA